MTAGTILKEIYMKKYKLTQYRLSKEVGIHEGVLAKIISGKGKITVGVAVRLARYFGVSEWVFLIPQLEEDILEITKKSEDELAGITPVIPLSEDVPETETAAVRKYVKKEKE